MDFSPFLFIVQGKEKGTRQCVGTDMPLNFLAFPSDWPILGEALIFTF
jgi:hypothetical protein